jgi:hypothetical protein
MESPGIDKLMAALAALHNEFGVVIEKDSKGHKGKFASLPCVLREIHRMCKAHGLVLHQGSCIAEGRPALLTTLFHVASQQLISTVSLLTANPEGQSHDQMWGGSITYHRRYDAMMLMGICSSDDPTDHDGNGHATKVEKVQASTPQSTATSSAPAGVISVKQLGLLRSKINGDDVLEASILTQQGIKSLNEMPWKNFNKVLENL